MTEPQKSHSVISTPILRSRKSLGPSSNYRFQESAQRLHFAMEGMSKICDCDFKKLPRIIENGWPCTKSESCRQYKNIRPGEFPVSWLSTTGIKKASGKSSVKGTSLSSFWSLTSNFLLLNCLSFWHLEPTEQSAEGRIVNLCYEYLL